MAGFGEIVEEDLIIDTDFDSIELREELLQHMYSFTIMKDRIRDQRKTNRNVEQCWRETKDE